MKGDKLSLASGHAMGSRVVHVSMPAAIAFDLDRFQGIQKSILDRLGCGACCSGWDIRWDIQRDFVVDQKLEVHEVGRAIGNG